MLQIFVLFYMAQFNGKVLGLGHLSFHLHRTMLIISLHCRIFHLFKFLSECLTLPAVPALRYSNPYDRAGQN